jgi:FolB domain-containing protein
MEDRILIQDLLVRVVIGAYPEERDIRQNISLTLELFTNIRPASNSDKLSDAVNYHTLSEDIIQLAENSRYRLIETLAEAVASHCLQDERIAKVRVRLDKPDALRYARSVAVCITREHGGN